jgi:hypothetical protein
MTTEYFFKEKLFTKDYKNKKNRLRNGDKTSNDGDASAVVVSSGLTVLKR